MASNKIINCQKSLKASKLLTGGGILAALNELVESGFVSKIYPYGKQEKNALYRLTDEFSLFYLKFMQHKSSNEKKNWIHINTLPGYTSWSGYAYENICFVHIGQIKKRLQIAGMHSSF